MNEIYESKFVEELFDKMSGSYDRMNYITSFGFSSLWRRKCLKNTNIQQAEVIVDLLSGMGECWKPITKVAPKGAKIIALDFSGEMVRHAKNKAKKFPNNKIEVLKENVFKNSIESNSVDCVISGFGLKTFTKEQLEDLAQEIERMMKPNGTFSLIDVSVPKSKFLSPFYMFYLKRVIPFLGRIFLGNAQTYRMLGIYTEKFNDSKEVFEIFRKFNFEVDYQNYFFGCATGITGRKVDGSLPVKP